MRAKSLPACDDQWPAVRAVYGHILMRQHAVNIESVCGECGKYPPSLIYRHRDRACFVGPTHGEDHPRLHAVIRALSRPKVLLLQCCFLAMCASLDPLARYEIVKAFARLNTV